MKELLLLLITVSLLFSCEKDNDEPNSDSYDSYVTHNNNTKELVKGYISIEDYYVELVLFSEGIDIDFNNGGTQGNGVNVYLNFVSESELSLLSGTYTTDDSLDHFIDVPILFSDSSLSPPVAFFSNEGSVEVTSGGYGNLTLTFDIIDSNGQHVSGKWIGDLTIIE